MGQLINFGNTKQWNVSGAIAGLSLKTYLYGNANNVLPLAADYDANAVTLTVEAKIGGQDFTIYSGPLAVAAMESAFRDALYIYSNPKVFGQGITVLAQAAGNAGEVLIPMVLDFGTIVNFVDSDSLKIKVQAERSVLGASINNVSSYIDVDVIEGLGYGSFIPQIRIETVTNGDQTFDFSLGNKVKGVTILERSKTYTSAIVGNNPWVSIQLTSDKLKVSDNYTDLLLKRIAQFNQSLPNSASDRGYSFQLYALPIPLNNVRLEGTLVPANVVNSSCLIVTRSSISSPAMKARADAKRRQHIAENDRTIYGI